MFAELLASNGVVEDLDLAAPVGLMALHGGLEAGTEVLAERVAEATGASRYAVVQADGVRWHVPSISCDPAASRQLSRFLAHVDVVVSVHGYGRRGMEHTVLLGGSNRCLAAEIADAITATTKLDAISDLDDIPRTLRGVHPANPVNLTRRGGVQIELPSGARSGGHLDALADALGAVVAAELERPG
jgi:phage replication-related protein YjqB (UPF0714/DUF867 family)